MELGAKQREAQNQPFKIRICQAVEVTWSGMKLLKSEKCSDPIDMTENPEYYQNRELEQKGMGSFKVRIKQEQQIKLNMLLQLA